MKVGDKVSTRISFTTYPIAMRWRGEVISVNKVYVRVRWNGGSSFNYRRHQIIETHLMHEEVLE